MGMSNIISDIANGDIDRPVLIMASSDGHSGLVTTQDNRYKHRASVLQWLSHDHVLLNYINIV